MGSENRTFNSERHVEALYDYTSIAAIKLALRSLLRLQARSEMGCTMSQVIVIDLKTALGQYPIDRREGKQVLTDRQKQAILLHLVLDRSIEETAEALGINPTAVSHRISSGVKRIVEFLATG